MNTSLTNSSRNKSQRHQLPSIWNFSKTLLACAALFCCSNVIADSKSKERLNWGNEFRFFIEGALHKGSDSTINIPFYDRNADVFVSGVEIAVFSNFTGTAAGEVSIDEIEAGGYFRGSFGAEFPVAKNLAFSTSIGFLYDEITGDLTDGSGGRGSAAFRTTQIDFLGFYLWGRHRIGLGGSFHYKPVFDYKERGVGFEMQGVYDFTSALGASIQYDFLASENISLGIRYTHIEYDFDKVRIDDFVGDTGDTFVANCLTNCNNFIDASSFSGHITYRF